MVVNLVIGVGMHLFPLDVCSLFWLVGHPCIRPCVQSYMCLCMCSFIHLFIHSVMRLFIRSIVCPLIHACVCSCSHVLVHVVIHLLVHCLCMCLLIGSFMLLLWSIIHLCVVHSFGCCSFIYCLCACQWVSHPLDHQGRLMPGLAWCWE